MNSMPGSVSSDAFAENSPILRLAYFEDECSFSSGIFRSNRNVRLKRGALFIRFTVGCLIYLCSMFCEYFLPQTHTLSFCLYIRLLFFLSHYLLVDNSVCVIQCVMQIYWLRSHQTYHAFFLFFTNIILKPSLCACFSRFISLQNFLNKIEY